MPRTPGIKFDDIIIAETHLGGYDYERCKNGLWSIHNVIKRIISDSADSGAKLLECLHMIGANAAFADNAKSSLVYSGKTNKKYKRNMPSAKYLFRLEEYGFVFSEIETTQKDTVRSKLSVKNIQRFTLSYNSAGHSECDCDCIFGLKLFSDICMTQSGDCFYAGDIRVAFASAPKLYAPPVDEVFYFLPAEQQITVYAIHNKLEELGCARNLEREYMTKYFHPKGKRQVFATIFAAEDLYFLPESEKWRKLTFKFNLRNINSYAGYLAECIDSIIKSVTTETTDCYGCKKACGGIKFSFGGANYAKCPVDAFRFYDLSEKAVKNYIKLLEFEDREIRGGRA